MDTSNWRPTQGTEPTMDTSDWRSQLLPDSRQRIVNKIMDTLKRHLPVTGQEGLLELRKIAQRFEEKIYTAATSQSDYLRKISLKMLTMENKSQNTMVNPMQSNPGGPSNKPIDSGISMQSQVHNPAQSHAVPLPNQPQSRQQLLSQNIQNNIAPPVSNIGQTPIQNVVGPNSNMQNNMFGGPQRQMPARQQVVPQQQQQQQQQQSQNSQHYLYQQQFMKHKPQLGNIQHPLMQSHIHQQQQQQPQQQQPQQQQPQQQQQQPNLQQPNQLQSSQQSVMQNSSVMQPSIMQTSSLSSLQQNQQSNNAQQSSQPMLQQHPQTVLRQQQQQPSVINQQQTPITQQSLLTPQQQQQLLAQQSNVTNIQHPQLGQQNNVADMQQHQRLLVGQNNLPNLSQQQQQQQLINQQSNLSNVHQQQLGSNVSGLQQQQLLETQSGNSGMQTSQHSGLMLQQSKVPMQQQSQQNVSNLLPSQGQQSQQQLMPQMQSQPAQLQQQLSLQQQQPNSLQRDMQQRFQASGSLLQQQKQLYQSQRALPDSSSSLDSTAQTGQPSGDDWQEEVFQKIKQMKESYLPELNEMYQKIATKLQQHDSLPQQPKSDQLDKLKMFKTMLERIIAFLQVSKANILPNFKEKIGAYEKQIINFISTNRPRKTMSSLQPGQLPPPHMHSISQPQSQLTQVHPHENQMNSQLQSTNLQSSIGTMQQNNMASLQHNSIPSMTGVSTAQQNMMNSIQPSSNIDSGQGNGMNSLPQVAVSPLQQNPVNAPQQTSISSLSSQGGGNVLQQNLNPLQLGSSMLQHQQLKQQ